MDNLVAGMEFYTPADIEYLFRKVTQKAFEIELAEKKDCRVGTRDFTELLLEIKPSLSEHLISQFEKDCEKYTRL